MSKSPVRTSKEAFVLNGNGNECEFERKRYERVF